MDLRSLGLELSLPTCWGWVAVPRLDRYDIYAPALHSKRVLALTDSLNIYNWAHIMNDAGGVWTWELAKQAPERLSRLII